MIYELASMMATMMIIVVILLAITKDRKGLKLNSPRQACHIMPSLIPSPRPPPDDKLSLVVPFCSPAILSPKHQKMTINIPPAASEANCCFLHSFTKSDGRKRFFSIISSSRQIDSLPFHHSSIRLSQEKRLGWTDHPSILKTCPWP